MGGDLLLLGMSHRSSPVELRERLAVEGDALEQRVRELRGRAHLPEALLLSTCNRVEVYVGGDVDGGAADAVREFLSRSAGQPLEDYLYERRGKEAVRHAFRVASSLDSLVIGEPQILGQVKEAYAIAKTAGAIGSLLDRCFTQAFSVAKRVRHETDIAEGSVNISSIAGELARKIFGELEGKRVLLIGAGEMGEQAAKHLRKAGATLYIVNRSRDKAEALAAEFEGHARGLEALATELALADVAIASTSSQRFVVKPELMRGVIKARRHRPLFLIDIAVPRDIDPRIGEMDNVFLFDVDDLQKVADENLEARRRAADDAEQIVTLEVAAFEKWQQADALKPTIVDLRTKVRGVLESELERTLPRLPELSERELRSLSKMIDAMTNKLLHHPISELKAGGGSPEGRQLVESTRRLFDLEQTEPGESEETDTVEMDMSLEPATNRGKAS